MSIIKRSLFVSFILKHFFFRPRKYFNISGLYKKKQQQINKFVAIFLNS